jgi:hypothetical protein
MVQAHRARLPLITFAFVAACIYAAALSITRMRASLDRPELVTLGVLSDLIVVVPVAWYLLAVRWGGLRKLSLVPVVLISVAGAALVLPQDRALLGSFLKALAIPYEIGLAAWIALRVWRSSRRSRGTEDMAERLREVAREAFPHRRVADMLAFEIAVLYYALFSWRSRPHETLSGEAFTYHRKSGYGALLFALAMVTAAEATPVHLLLARWSAVAAWIVTALSAYGMLWFVADWRAARLRPIVLEADTLWVRTGLRWSVRIPRERVAAVHRKLPSGAGPSLRAALPGATPLWIELAEPVAATGPYGIERRVRWIGVAVDDAERFRAALQDQDGNR